MKREERWPEVANIVLNWHASRKTLRPCAGGAGAGLPANDARPTWAASSLIRRHDALRTTVGWMNMRCCTHEHIINIFI